MPAITPSTWGRVEGLLRRANRIAGLVIYVNEGTAELWFGERSGDKPYEEPALGPLTADVSSIVGDAPDPDPAKVMVAGSVRFTVPSWYGDASIGGEGSWATFEEAVAAARSTIELFEYPGQTPDHRYSTAMVALRAEWRNAPQDGVSLGSDAELLRWRVTRSRVILEPLGHGATDAQVAAAEALDDSKARRAGWA